MSRRVTLMLTLTATILLVAAVFLLDRTTGIPLMPLVLVLGALALGTLAISRAWTRPDSSVDQPSAEGSVAGPT